MELSKMDPVVIEEVVNQEIQREIPALVERFRAPFTMLAQGYRDPAGRHRRWTLQFGDHVYVLIVLKWEERKPLFVGVSSGTNDVEELSKAREGATAFRKAVYVASELKRHLNRFLITYSVMEA